MPGYYCYCYITGVHVLERVGNTIIIKIVTRRSVNAILLHSRKNNNNLMTCAIEDVTLWGAENELYSMMYVLFICILRWVKSSLNIILNFNYKPIEYFALLPYTRKTFIILLFKSHFFYNKSDFFSFFKFK